MADLNLDLSGIKPLLGQLGLGQAPAATAPPVNQMPFPPMPPPPTPAQAGFTAYSADPRNQQTIANSLTMPGTPITPPNVPPASPLSPYPTPAPAAPALKSFNPMASIQPMASAVPSMPAPNAPNVQLASPPTMAADMAAHPDQYQKPGLVGQGWKGFLKYGVPAALMSAGSGLSNMGRGNPTAGADWLAGQVANDRGIPAANAAQYDLRNIKPLKDAAALADTQSQTAQRNAAAKKADTAADDMEKFTLSPAQATAINHPELAGTTATMRDYSRLVGMAGNNNTSTGNNAATNAAKVTTNAATNTTRTATNAATNTARTAIADAANKTRTLVANMHDATSRANNENTVSSKVGGPASGGGFKVPADVTKRAALGSNVLENADAVEGIINKRPDIIGAAGGRYSNVQQMIGSDDPDIQALGVRMHNIALASNGAHGVRAQQAIQKTEDELFGNFKAGPNAIKGALGATRASMQTFLNDEQNFSTTGKRTGSGAPGPPPAAGGNSVTAPDGTIHSFPNAAAAAQFKKAAGIK